MEKLTDFDTLTAYNAAFGHTYHTEGNADLFGSKYPDGWDWLNEHTLLIIENKSDVSKSKAAQQQLSAYCSTAMQHPDVQTIVAVNGFGNKSNFVYHIYEFTAQGKLNKLKDVNDFNDLRQLYPDTTKNKRTDVVTLQTMHNLLVKETGIDGAKELSIFCAFLILASNLPSMRKLLAQCNQPQLLFNTIMDLFESFYGADPIVKRLLMTPKLKTVNMLNLLRMAATLKQTSLTTLFKQFCKYTKTKQDKNIELTPIHIIAVMKKILEQYDYTSVIDPFAGSSEFLLHVKPDAQKTAYEINEYMYLLSKINLEINRVKNCDLKCCDTSKTEFMADVCITNPPYTKALSGRHAIEWLTLLIDRVNVIIAIIPTTNISDAKQFTPYKKALLDAGYKPRKVINCGKCFKGVGVEASILVMDNYEDITPIHVFDMVFVNKIDYIKPPRNAMKILKPGLKKMVDVINDDNYTELTNYNENTDWSKPEQTETETFNVRSMLIKNYETTLFERIHTYLTTGACESETLSTFIRNDIQTNQDQLSSYLFEDSAEPCETVRVGDMFEIIKGKSRNSKDVKEVNMFPLIAASRQNNGVCGLLTEYDFDENCLSVACDGDSAGYVFHQSGKFSKSPCVKLLKLRECTSNANEIYDLFAKYLTPKLSSSYDYMNKLSEEKLLNETVQIPTRLVEMLLKPTNARTFKIGDMFDIVKGPIQTINDTQPGEFPLISATTKNNGIVARINAYDYDENCLTFVYRGGPGTCFHQKGKFSKTTHIKVLKFKQHYDHADELYELFAKCITAQISPKYTFNMSLDEEKTLNETIQIPSHLVDPLLTPINKPDE